MCGLELVFVGVKIPKAMKEQVNDAIKRGVYATQSELVRAALRKLFEEAA